MSDEVTINKVAFTASTTCQSGQHCTMCRNLRGGRMWRRNLATRFSLPDDAPDFACPYGKQWNGAQPQIDKVPIKPQPTDREKGADRQLKRKGCGCSRNG